MYKQDILEALKNKNQLTAVQLFNTILEGRWSQFTEDLAELNKSQEIEGNRIQGKVYYKIHIRGSLV
jgi:hypothetical protein